MSNMFGKTFMKLGLYAIIGAIAVALGTQLLASVVSVVYAIRRGNIIPLVIIVTLSVVTLRVARKLPDESMMGKMSTFLAYTMTGYAMAVAFIGLLSVGLSMSILGAIAVLILCASIYEPDRVRVLLGPYSTQLKMSLQQTSGSSSKISPYDPAPIRVHLPALMMHVENGSREALVNLMLERPLLPISLTHLEEYDVVYIDSNQDPLIADRVQALFEACEINTRRVATPFLEDVLAKLPIIDEEHGLAMCGYKVVTDEQTVKHLLDMWPPRMSVIPSRKGLTVILPESSAPGLPMDPIPSLHIHKIILFRDYSILKEVKHVQGNPT
ncbi:MAG: hypothetical protein ACFE7R_08840 [Candidatus Hodarchaeota archaeon]